MNECVKCGHPASDHFWWTEPKKASCHNGEDTSNRCGCNDFLVREAPAPTRDMLLSEVRRSLMATHPDRAEALCAALERRVPRSEPPKPTSGGRVEPGWREIVGRPVVPHEWVPVETVPIDHLLLGDDSDT